jgi:hypothetical protein
LEERRDLQLAVWVPSMDHAPFGLLLGACILGGIYRMMVVPVLPLFWAGTCPYTDVADRWYPVSDRGI